MRETRIVEMKANSASSQGTWHKQSGRAWYAFILIYYATICTRENYFCLILKMKEIYLCFCFAGTKHYNKMMDASEDLSPHQNFT